MTGCDLVFKRACEAAEFQRIHALNYRTFVEEIPQHPPNSDRLLIDRFHPQNTYFIGLHGANLAGMVAVRDAHPFSLEEKFQTLHLGLLEDYLPEARRCCEVRLLSIAPPYRRTACLPGLLALVADWCRNRGCDQVVVSATTRQLKLYHHLGFVPFGPLLGRPEACYQPMVLTEAVYAIASVGSRRTPSASSPRNPLSP